MAHSERDFCLRIEPELNRIEISEEEIDLVWSVFQELIRLANVYLPEESD